jgi:hypothetical protein
LSIRANGTGLFDRLAADHSPAKRTENNFCGQERKEKGKKKERLCETEAENNFCGQERKKRKRKKERKTNGKGSSRKNRLDKSNVLNNETKRNAAQNMKKQMDREKEGNRDSEQEEEIKKCEKETI